MEVKRITRAEYLAAIEEGRTTHLHGITTNRAETITVDGVIYSEDAHRAAKRYTWKQYPNKQIWFYMSENGDILEVVNK